MADKIKIKLSRIDVLDLVKFLHHTKFAEEFAARFKRIEDDLQQQFLEQSTIEEINETVDALRAIHSGQYFPEVIGE